MSQTLKCRQLLGSGASPLSHQLHVSNVEMSSASEFWGLAPKPQIPKATHGPYEKLRKQNNFVTWHASHVNMSSASLLILLKVLSLESTKSG